MISIPLAVAVAAWSALGSPPDALPPGLEPASAWELGGSIGGGWDSNALGASAPISSAFGSARAWIARRFEASDADDLWLQLHYDGARYASASEVDLDRPELGVEWAHAFDGGTIARATGRAALRFQGDSGRDGWDVGARLLVRFPLGDRFGLRLGTELSHRDARDSAYAWTSGRGEVGADAPLWTGASATARYTLDVGTDTFYTAPAGGWGGSGGMGTGGTGTAGMGSARAARRIAHGVFADVLQLLPGGAFLQAGYGIGVERGGGSTYVTHSVLAEVGWRY